MLQNVVLAAVALLLFATFVGYLMVQIAAVPLGVIIVAVVAMCALDFVLTAREGR